MLDSILIFSVVAITGGLGLMLARGVAQSLRAQETKMDFLIKAHHDAVGQMIKMAQDMLAKKEDDPHEVIEALVQSVTVDLVDISNQIGLILEHQEKLAAKKEAQKRSPEARERISQSQKLRWEKQKARQQTNVIEPFHLLTQQEPRQREAREIAAR